MADQVHLRPGDMETICVGLASGDSLHKLVEQTGIPLKVFWRLMADDPALKAQYEFALQCKAQRWMEEAVEIADNKHLKGDDKRIQIDTRMKMAAKYFPERFGESTKVEHTGPNGGAIKTESKWTVEFVNATSNAAPAS